MNRRAWFLLLIMAALVLALSMDSPTTAYAQSSLTVTININIDPPGTGTVTITPEKESYNWLDIVTITAEPNPGWRFSHWSGDDAAWCANPQVFVQVDRNCTAHFENNFFVFITIKPDEGDNEVLLDPPVEWVGSPFPIFPKGYEVGTIITLETIADDDGEPYYSFEGWIGPNAQECQTLELEIIDHNIYCTAVFQEQKDPPDNYHRWMTDIAPKIENRRLTDLVIPGSHDAGTYSFGFAADWIEPPIGDWDKIEKYAPLVGQEIVEFAAKWSKTQSGNINWQLKSGSRYFDLRVRQRDDGKLVIHHGKLWSNHTHTVILNQVDAFLTDPDDDHAKEIIILDFTELRDIDEAHHKEFIDDLLRLFKGKMIPAAYEHALLSDIWVHPNHPQLVVRYEGLDETWFDDDDYENTNPEDFKLFWPASKKYMCRPWANAQKESDLKVHMEEELACPCCGEGYDACEQFFMLQALLTPDKGLKMMLCGLNRELFEWTKEFDWFCKIPIVGPATCGLIDEGLDSLCLDNPDWENAPRSMWDLAAGSTSPGGITPKAVGWVVDWWDTCDQNSRDTLNIIGVDYIEADDFVVIEEAIKLNEVYHYNSIPSFDPLTEAPSGLEGHIIELKIPYEDSDACDFHMATINWGDGTGIEQAKAHDVTVDPIQRKVVGSHVYADNDTYNVEVCLQDGPNIRESMPFINEIHYDNLGEDVGEMVEIAGKAGFNLSSWSLELYDGQEGLGYNTILLDERIPDLLNGYGTITVPTPGIKNGMEELGDPSSPQGDPDGIALVDPDGKLIQFLCYEGVFEAKDGPALGVTCEDIGVFESEDTPEGMSLQLNGFGAIYEDFYRNWQEPIAETFGEINSEQFFNSDFYPYSETCTTLQIVVDNVAPMVDAGVDQIIYEGDFLTLDPASFNDLGTLDTHSAEITWGDGSAPEDGMVAESPYGPPGSILGANGSVSGSHQYTVAPGIYHAEVCVTDDDGAETCDMLQVTLVHGFFKNCLSARKPGDDLMLEEGAFANCSIRGEGKVELKKDAEISGDLIAVDQEAKIEEGAAVGGSVASDAKVEIKKEASVGENVSSGDDVKVEENAVVGGDIYAAGKVEIKDGATVMGDIYRNYPVPSILDVTYVEVDVDAGRSRVRVRKNKILSLAPGDYGKLFVQKGATLILSDGTYSFHRMNMSKNATLQLELNGGDLIIEVQDNINFAERVNMTVSGGDASNILLQVEGKALKLGKHGTFLGTFIAPYAHIEVAESAMITGALHSDKVHMKKESRTYSDPALDLFIDLYVK